MKKITHQASQRMLSYLFAILPESENWCNSNVSSKSVCIFGSRNKFFWWFLLTCRLLSNGIADVKNEKNPDDDLLFPEDELFEGKHWLYAKINENKPEKHFSESKRNRNSLHNICRRVCLQVATTGVRWCSAHKYIILLYVYKVNFF